MDLFSDLASGLLSFSKQLFGPGICPGDWVWATGTAGALIALLPIIGALGISVIRKFTGNTYSAVTLSVFGVIGVVFVGVLPWVLMAGVSETFRIVAAGGRGGLSQGEVAALNTTYCDFIGDQSVYLGKGPGVFDTLFYPGGNELAYGFYLGTLVGLPILSLIFVMLQGKLAFRRGPAWPARFFWVPFVGLALLSVTVNANTAIHLWLGFLPVSVLGLIPIAVVGPPSWHAIRRADQRKARREVAPPQQPPQRPVQPPPPPPGNYPPTAVAPTSGESAMAGAVPVPIPARAPTSDTRYQRTRRLGHGGFGTVWQAYDTQLNRTVALKIAHAPDRDTEERMQREARALAALDHPNCVRVYDLVEQPEGLALVMEYLDGDALASAVDERGPIDDVAAARLWSTTASALIAAHDKGVLHRDVKPSNIIVDPRGIPHLIDFGIARSKGDSAMTATGMMIGTPDYTAPEVANGAGASPASDAWQLAATVSFALTGRPPRGDRENPMAALLAASRAEAPTELPSGSVHARLLTAALDAEPRNRPTLGAVVEEMNAWLSGVGESREGPVTRVIPRQ
ncbi:serine/threonine-protein kinase [Haloechinothrix salitolerans]|uniref:non-specific serine/threonine protein kinase n=1 Tax=Haloechinothrix salitolerans TaxID=926830 RepID=A0ABW2BWH2_9PSEU